MSDFEHLSSDEDQTTYGTLEECEGAWEVLSEDSPSHWSEVTDLVVLSEDDDDEEGDGEDEATRTAGEGTPAAEHKKESRAARRRREKQQKKAQKTAAKALVLAQTKQQQQQTVSAGRFEPLFQLGGSTSSVEEVHRRLAHEEVKQRAKTSPGAGPVPARGNPKSVLAGVARGTTTTNLTQDHHRQPRGSEAKGADHEEEGEVSTDQEDEVDEDGWVLGGLR